MPETWGLWDKHRKRFVRVFDGQELWTGTEQQAWRITNDTERMGEAVPIRLDNLPRPGEILRWVTCDARDDQQLLVWPVNPDRISSSGLWEHDGDSVASYRTTDDYILKVFGITPPESGKKIKVRIIVEECE